MNYSKNARALRRGLLVILQHGLRQTPRDWNTLKSSALFFVRISQVFKGTTENLEKPLSE